MKELKYKGIGGDEGLKQFEVEKNIAVIQLSNIIDFMARNKEVVSAWDIMAMRGFLTAELEKLNSD